MKKMLPFAVLAFALPQLASAAQPYVAGQFMQSKSSCQGFIDGVAPLGLTADCDDTDSGFRVAAGVHLNDTFGLEVGYQDAGEGVADAFSGNTQVLTLTAPLTAWDVLLTARREVATDLRLVARAGAARWDYEVRNSAGGSFNPTNSRTTPTFGAGLELKWFTLGYDAILNVGQENVLAPSEPDIKQTVHRLSVGLKYAF